MKKFLLLTLVLCSFLWVRATPPTNYYQIANQAQGDSLRFLLESIIAPHTEIDYDDLRYFYKYSDTKDNAGDSIIDIYSNCMPPYTDTFNLVNYCNDGLQREHTVPKSWFNNEYPMYCDAFHIYPVSRGVNASRSNTPYGENDGTPHKSWSTGHRGTNTTEGFTETTFEPADEYKGDLARTYFYMATCYADTCSSWTGEMFGSENNGFRTWAINMLLRWNREDPVSDKERKRNELIYNNDKMYSIVDKNDSTQRITFGPFQQGNRNPFIDYPYLAEYIWGRRQGKKVDFSLLTSSYTAGFDTLDNRSGGDNDPLAAALLAPLNLSRFVMSDTYSGDTLRYKIWIESQDLAQNVHLTCLDTTQNFSLTQDSLMAQEVNIGRHFEVNYHPRAAGNDSTIILITSAEVDTTRLTLLAHCDVLSSTTPLTTLGKVSYYSTQGRVYLQNLETNATLFVYTTTGQRIKTFKTLPTDLSFELPQGLYIFQLVEGSQNLTFKILI